MVMAARHVLPADSPAGTEEQPGGMEATDVVAAQASGSSSTSTSSSSSSTSGDVLSEDEVRRAEFQIGS